MGMGGQGLLVMNDTFDILEKGYEDIRAQGRWGTRYVTYLKMTHRATQKTFWHFNTHWCVSPYCDSLKRWDGSKNMLQIIKDKAGDDAVIITGDLNGHVSEPGMQEFLLHGYTLGAYQMP